jgi:hypothetical protein
MATARVIEGEVVSRGPESPRRDALHEEQPLHDRFRGAGGLFRNENLDMLSKVLDTWFRVPGTNIRFGLDGIIGFVPGVGDFLAGAASCILVLAAFFRGVPLVTVARMVANLGIEVVVGVVPVLGNLFDIGWRANRRNYALLERSLSVGRRDTWRDWLFMGLLGILLMTMAMVPFLLLLWLGGSLFHSLHAPGW